MASNKSRALPVEMGPAPGTCQWIDGDPKVDPKKCGDRALPGEPWCLKHFKKVYPDSQRLIYADGR